ncbi:MAG: valine--tRNA ligase [Candidatus Eisenbacteria bacterium]|nr:valine--tRNA ligase [Candidatus Latescibacterota bacterium]MBD3300927.1 valine--tRNA ligase [Candidatus Eisenbacteria bacterium]
MSGELGQTYDPKSFETETYELWERSGGFHAEPTDSGDSYCIVIPPPNVTAELHLGHALNNTLQDILIRHHRMSGRNTLWMPGTDHAGIATQTVVEKRLQEEEGKRRTEYGREEFIGRVQAWKDDYETRIINQLRRIGCSCDWRRTRFTMDEVCARAVRATFLKLFEDGLIYRGKRLVNWDPATQTVLADDEVEHREVHGHFYYMKYPLAEPVEIAGERVETITIATTRPETMLGDTGIAINPTDPRAKALVGRKVRLPLVGRLIPIVADDHVVLPDPESDDEKAKFSTGFLKVTPAHDPDDYQIGQRHDLEMINVLAPDGTISDRYGWPDARGTDAETFLGLDRFEARKAIVEWFREERLLEEVREYIHQVGHSYRSHVPIEPYLSDQWYVAVQKAIPGIESAEPLPGTGLPGVTLAGLALEPLLDGRLRFVPERYATTYQVWLENLRDWPISRQLWWGHRIPLWTRELPKGAGDPDAALDAAAGEPFRARLERFAIRAAVRTDPHPEEPETLRTAVCLESDDPEAIAWLESKGWKRDPDVLDTWFSSSLWPFSTLEWPERSDLLDTYYPGNVLCTARDIITLWVSRMVMMGRYCVGDVPFPDVFIHTMIQDGLGRRMSKSLGNGIDPLVIVDSHGADAMRFTLASMTTQTQDVRMPVEEVTLPDGRKVNSSPKFTIGRNFCNKLWNASRFVMRNLEDLPDWSETAGDDDLSDRWIRSRMHATIRDATEALRDYRFNELADGIYHFVWDDFCDWYLEIAKSRIQAGEAGPKAVLAHVLDTILRLLHPVMPFITETIWQKLGETAPRRGPIGEAETLLIRAAWPKADSTAIDGDLEERFAELQELIREIRNVRSHHNVPPGRRLDLLIEVDEGKRAHLEPNLDLLASQARLGEVRLIDDAIESPGDAASAAVSGTRFHLLGVVDREAERARLKKQMEKLLLSIQSLEKKLGNESFLSKAPAEVVEKERSRLDAQQDELRQIERLIEELG